MKWCFLTCLLGICDFSFFPLHSGNIVAIYRNILFGRKLGDLASEHLSISKESDFPPLETGNL